MSDVVRRHLAGLVADAERAGVRLRLDDRPWQEVPPTAESLLVCAPDGTARGVWCDTAVPPLEQQVAVVDQAHDFVVELMPRVHRSTSWPGCPDHPGTHPLEVAADDARGRAVWRCPRSRTWVADIGSLDPGD